jgi:hypothetical protein
MDNKPTANVSAADFAHFRFLLEGRVFRILTDHKPFLAALHSVLLLWSARQQ